MKKKFFTFLTLLLCLCSGAWAQTYDNENVTVTWSMSSGTLTSGVASPSAAALSSGNNVGTDAELNGTTTGTFKDKSDESKSYLFTLFARPSSSETGSSSTKRDNRYVEYTFTPAKGLTFTPTGVSFEMVKNGTGDPNIWVDFIDGTSVTTSLATNTSIPKVESSKYDVSESQKSYNMASLETVHASSNKVTLRIFYSKLASGKSVGIRNVVISGKVSGTVVNVTTYTITAEANDDDLGSVAGGETYEENDDVTLTATPKTGAKFVKWQKDDEDFVGNTANPLNITATETVTYTAIFEALNKITFSANGGSGNVPDVSYVDDGDDYTLPTWKLLYKEGNTFAGWKTGETTYTAGQTLENITDDVTFAAQWTANTVALGDAATTVEWTFIKDDGAPSLAMQGTGATRYYVVQASVSGSNIDVPLYIDATSGKFDTANHDSYAQVNGGTKFRLPAVAGMTVTYSSGSGTHTDASKFAFDDAANVNASMSSNNLVFTYNGKNGTITFTDNDGGMWPTGISVTYPKYVPTPAEAETTGAVLTYSNGSVSGSGKVWTGTADTECEGYTITADASGSISVKSSTKYALGVGESGATYTIAVPSGVKITSFKITGAANSSTSYVTYNETQKSFANSGDTEQTWTVASPSAGGSIEFSVTTKQLNVTSITLYTDDITLTTTVNMAGWRAFYDASQGYTVDGGTKVYKATAKSASSVTLTEMVDIPAATPVILYHESATDSHKMTLTKAATTSGNASGNLLSVTTADQDLSSGTYYRLGYSSADGIGFYPYSTASAAAGIVYIDASAGARMLTFVFDNETSGIEAVHASGLTVNGFYNLNGQRVENPTKGLYIVNGKKVVIK